jgi:hypothetical protein
METRTLLACALMLLIGLACTAAWLRFSREWRGERRAERRGARSRQRRRDERIREERGA